MSLRRVISGMIEQVEASARQTLLSDPYPSDVRRHRPPVVEPTPNEEHRPARQRPVQPVQTPAGPRSVRRSEIVAALASRSGVRQALVMQEILGPPKALQPWDGD